MGVHPGSDHDHQPASPKLIAWLCAQGLLPKRPEELQPHPAGITDDQRQANAEALGAEMVGSR